jgi:hypothetical protein
MPDRNPTEVEGTIFDIGFSKKVDISLIRILDRCRAFDLYARVDAHL